MSWPKRGTRVSMDSGINGPWGDGIVTQIGPEQCMVKWSSHGVEQSHPTSHLVPFAETRRVIPREIKKPQEKELDLEIGDDPFANPEEPFNPFKGLFEP